jgi:hypothetical protein
MLNEEIKELVEEAVNWAHQAAIERNEKSGFARTSALVSIAKSLAVIAGILEKATNGQASINTYDMSHPEI